MTPRCLAKLVTALAVLAILAGPAWSARVVEVRVGNHPTFTRVVFELDAPAGYQVERREVPGGQELVVTLRAASAPREVRSRSAMVEGVALEPSGTGSVARVRLRGDSPRMKELILGGPPRIVLDLMLSDEAIKAAASKPAAKPESKLVAKMEPPKLGEKPAPSSGAEATKAPGASEKSARPNAAEATPPPKVAEKPVAPKTEQKTASPNGADVEKLPSVAEKPAPTKLADTPKPRAEEKTPATPPAPAPPIAKVEEALEGERIVQPKPAATSPFATPPPTATPPPSATPPPPAPAPKPLAKPAAPVSPPSPQAGPKGPFGLDLDAMRSWPMLGLVGGGLLLFIVVVAMLLRRHSKPTSLDALEVARELGDPIGSGDAFSTIADSRAGERLSRTPSFPVAGPGLFDDERDKGESEMDAVIPIERARAARPSPSMEPDSEVGSMVQELERRLSQLESRLDQANEARERLERQVTAQSEELRVQRAAIARTQRALRGMTRVGDDQATEPALRDPSKPTTGRP